MKKYNKSWRSRIEGDLSYNWSSLSKPMRLQFNEDQDSSIFITASLEFSGFSKELKAKNHKGSLYYKIEVNGQPVSQYHVPNPRGVIKPVGINLHGKTDISAGNNEVEVFYKVSKNGSWDLLKNQNQRQLSVLTFPK